MRINVYAEEITEETSVVSKTVTDEEFGERTFYGIRFFLASPDVLHHSGEDDDRSAITLWVKANKYGEANTHQLTRLCRQLLGCLDEITY